MDATAYAATRALVRALLLEQVLRVDQIPTVAAEITKEAALAEHVGDTATFELLEKLASDIVADARDQGPNDSGFLSR